MTNHETEPVCKSEQGCHRVVPCDPGCGAPVVLPPPALTEEGRLRAQVQVLQQDVERDRGLAKVGARCMREGHQGLIEQGRLVLEGWRFALSTALDLGTGAPWEAIHERVKELGQPAPAAVSVPPPAPQAADRAAVSATLWAVAEHHTIAEWICCDPINPSHDLCVQGGMALRMLRALLVDDPEAAGPAPLLDAVLAVLPEPADRAAILTEAADRMSRRAAELTEGLDDFAIFVGKARAAEAEILNREADELRRLAAEAPTTTKPETAEPAVTLHAIPLPGSNGISSCCGRPPCEFVGERVTRDPDKVTCTGPAAGVRQDGATP